MGSLFENQQVVVTGATGLIGSHLVRKLLEEGAEVTAAGRNKEKLINTLGKLTDHDRLRCEAWDVVNGMPEDFGKIDYFFHAASPVSGIEIKEKPVETIKANLIGVQNGLEYLRKHNKGRMIIFSSATVYGNQMDREKEVGEEDTNMADALHTLNTPYSESKRMAEVLTGAYLREYGVDSVIARIGYVYGHATNMPNTAFYEFIKRAINGRDIILNDSGMSKRDNIHVEDVVNGLIIAALKGRSGDAYNISSNGEKGNYKAIDEIAAIIAKSANKDRLDKPIKCIVKPIEGTRKPGMRLNNAKLKELGWKLNVDMESGIENTYLRFKKEFVV